jgi:hypothetical protein
MSAAKRYLVTIAILRSAPVPRRECQRNGPSVGSRAGAVLGLMPSGGQRHALITRQIVNRSFVALNVNFSSSRVLTPKWPVLNLRVPKTNGPSEELRPKLPGKAFRKSADPVILF